MRDDGVMSAQDPGQQHIEEVELDLHGVVYTISILVRDDELLVVRIEDKETLDTWHGEFAAKYVEDITSKTGSFKKFSVFVRMLQTAILQQSDSVFVDLLTCQDLETLKARKAAAANGDATVQQVQPVRQLPSTLSSKRYLILTYASEFDRVHYPLPLLADEQPDPARFKAVIASLRQQLAAVQAGLPQPALLQPQGGQHLLATRQHRGSSRAVSQVVEADVAVLASRLEVAQAELEGERAAHRREMRKKAREIQKLQEELSSSRDTTRELRLRVKALEVDLETARSSLAAAAGPKPGYRRPAAADRYTYGSSTYLSGSSKFPSRPGQQHGSSHNSPRGTSPASSRGQSPSHSRPWAQNTTPPRPPRPNSAPPKPRFDPTEYVRQKRQREQQLVAARRSSSGSRGGSPAPSVHSRGGNSSGASTPRSSASHASSFNSRREHSLQGGSSGRGATGRLQQPTSGTAFSRPGSTGRQQRPGSSGGSTRSQLGAIYGVAPLQHSGHSSHSTSRHKLDKVLDQDVPSGRDGPGAASPGRALQGVRDKLDAYYLKQQQQQRMHAGVLRTTIKATQPAIAAAAASSRQMPSAGSRSPAASQCVFSDASTEIADIDQRLHALQNFLKMAKSSVGAT